MMASRIRHAWPRILRLLLGGLSLVPIPAWAAPSPTQLASAIDQANVSSYTTTAFAVSANTLVTFAITGALVTGTGINTPTITCHGATWVLINSQAVGNPERKLFVFRTLLANPSSSATCGYSFGGQVQGRSSYTVQEWNGVDTSGTNGSGAIVQSVPATGTGTPCTATLAAYGSSDNRPYFTCREGAAEAHTPEGGWIELSDPLPGEGMAHSAIWKNAADDTTPSITFPSGSAPWIAVAVEIKASAGGAGVGGRVIGSGLGAGKMID